MIIAKPQLGLIPAWQFNTAWPENPKYNNHVVYPPGWNQLTVQPVGPNYAPPPEMSLGRPRWFNRGARDCVCDSGHEWCCTNQMRGLGCGAGSAPGVKGCGMNGLGISDVWAKRLTIGGAVVAGLAAIAGLMYARK